MSVSSLSVENFRNLSDVDLAPAAGVNVIYGDNAAGKTSLLEALHFLARVRSFRSTRPEQLIMRGQEALLVRAEVLQSGSDLVRVGVQRTVADTRVRIAGQEVKSLSALARYFPIQVINSESQRLLQDGPKVRRSFLNWSVFHVEHEYHVEWRRFDRALKQRNAALKMGSTKLTRAWEGEFVLAAEALDRMRQEFVNALAEQVRPLLEEWLPGENVQIGYRAGWSAERSLETALEETRPRELDVGHSLVGPHRADIAFRSNGMEAYHRLSRGQQKLLVIAVLLGQVQLLERRGMADSILLIDDLPAELDVARRQRVLDLVLSSGAQAFITCTDRAALPLEDSQARWFHVEHGLYREVV